MKGDHIKYRAGYKYQLAEQYSIMTPIKGYDIQSYFISMRIDGLLTIKKCYAWDGCSGPTFDDKTNMRGGLVHDALYQLMREGKIPESYRSVADNLLRKICKEDGMNWFRDWYYFEGVDHLAKFAAKKGSDLYPIQEAP